MDFSNTLCEGFFSPMKGLKKRKYPPLKPTGVGGVACLAQVKVRRKLKCSDKDGGPSSPTIPSIAYDSVFDSGKELSSDVYSTVGTGSRTAASHPLGFLPLSL